jgi:hypothetical protein
MQCTETRAEERAEKEVVEVVVRGIAMAVSGDSRRDSGWWEVNQLLVSQSSQTQHAAAIA